MRVTKFAAAASAVAMLCACGGGGGSGGTGGGTGTAPTPTPTTATLPVTLSATSADVTVTEGQTQTFGFTASYTGASTQPVVANVTVGGTRYALEGTPTPSGSSFVVALKTAAFAPGGRTTSTITFRLCTSADCSTVYPGSTQTFTVNLDVQLKDWQMFQRDAAHAGYVAVRYDPARFTAAWERTVKEGLDARPVSATPGTIYVVEGQDDIPATQGVTDRLIALNASDGTARWIADLATHTSLSGATYANGLLLFTSYGPSGSDGLLHYHNAASGAQVARATFQTQYGEWLQPTVFANRAFVAAGFYGSEVFGYDGTTGNKLWQSFGSRGVTDGQSVAADGDSIYYYSATGVDLFDAASGTLKRTLANPYYPGGGYGWEGALMLDGSGGVFGMNGHRTWAYNANTIVGYATTSTSAKWQTAQTYFGHPALSDGLIYALRSNVRGLDAIRTADGSVAWSLDIPGAGNLRYNVVATANLVFVSTETNVYSFDISQAARPMVWTAAIGGSLAITPDNLLIVAGIDVIRAYRLS